MKTWKCKFQSDSATGRTLCCKREREREREGESNRKCERDACSVVRWTMIRSIMVETNKIENHSSRGISSLLNRLRSTEREREREDLSDGMTSVEFQIFLLKRIWARSLFILCPLWRINKNTPEIFSCFICYVT